MLFTFACIYVLARAILAPLPGLILRTFVPWIPHFLISFAVFISVIHVWIGFRGRRWRPLALFLTTYLGSLAVFALLTFTLEPSIVDEDSFRLAKIQEGFGSVMNLTVTSTLQHQVQNSSLIALDLVSRLPPASSDELVPMLQDFASRANEVSQSILFLNLLHQRAIETMSITNIMKVRGRTNTISMNMGMVVLRPFGLTQTPWHTRHEIGAAQLFTFAASATEIYIEELIDDIDKTVSLAMQLKSQLGSVCKCLLEKHIQLTRTEAETLLTLSASLPGKNDHADILELAKRMHLDLHTLRPWSLTHLDIAIHRLHQLVNEIKGLKIRVAESVRDMPGCPSAGSLAGVNVEEIRNIIEEFRAKHLL